MVMLKNAGRWVAAVVLSGAGLLMVPGLTVRAGQPPSVRAERMDPETSRRYARSWLENSLVCVGRLAHAVIQTPSGQTAVRDRFQEVAGRLFEADWKVAAMHEPAIDPARAGEAFRQAWEAARAVQPLGAEELIRAHGRPGGAGGSAASSPATALAALRAHQTGFLEDRGYAAVVPLLERETFDTEVVGTSLLKDAWFFVGLWTETSGWRAKNIQAERAMPPGRFRPAALDPYGGNATLDRLDTVFREVWEWRLRTMHGVRRVDRMLSRLTEFRLEPAAAALDVPPLGARGGGAAGR